MPDAAPGRHVRINGRRWVPSGRIVHSPLPTTVTSGSGLVNRRGGAAVAVDDLQRRTRIPGRAGAAAVNVRRRTARPPMRLTNAKRRPSGAQAGESNVTPARGQWVNAAQGAPRAYQALRSPKYAREE